MERFSATREALPLLSVAALPTLCVDAECFRPARRAGVARLRRLAEASTPALAAVGFFGLTLLAWLAKVGAVSREEVEATVGAPALLLEVVVEVDSRDEPRTGAGPLAAERVARTGVDRPEDEEAAEEEEGAILLNSQWMKLTLNLLSLLYCGDADGD